MKDAENKFIKFLEEEGVLEEYKANFVNNKGNDGFVDFKARIKFIDTRDFILLAFPWGHASEEEKWRAIHYKWQDFINHDDAKMKNVLTAIALCGIFLILAYVIPSLVKWFFIKLMGEK